MEKTVAMLTKQSPFKLNGLMELLLALGSMAIATSTSALLCLPALALAQSSQLSGYVTAVQPSGTFDIDGVHVRLTPATEFRTRASASSATVPASAPAAFYIGQTLDAKGKLDHSTHTLTAARIVLVSATPATIDGTAIIDLIPPAPATQPASDHIVRADGYLLHITPKTKLKFTPPLTSLSDLSTNQWIDYTGVEQSDGTVLLTYAGIGPNRISHNEQKFRDANEYDPAAVTNSSHQDHDSRVFYGTDPRLIPLYHDAEIQARVRRIGESVVPTYQHALPASDPAKINFRFPVIDTTRGLDAYTLPSGIIIVPRQVVERMQNDSQLAAVLADHIVQAIEKFDFRYVSAVHPFNSSHLADDKAGFFKPSPWLYGPGLGPSLVESHLHALQLQQSARISLGLLHDAGYDITQAPLAWWLLAPKSPQPVDQIPMPPRATTLYKVLGTTWHPAEASTRSNARQ